MKGLIGFFRELTRYRSAVLGILIIGGLIALALYTVVALPYHEAIRLWRGGEEIWGDYPRNALPQWVTIFTGNSLPRSIILDSRQ